MRIAKETMPDLRGVVDRARLKRRGNCLHPSFMLGRRAITAKKAAVEFVYDRELPMCSTRVCGWLRADCRGSCCRSMVVSAI